MPIYEYICQNGHSFEVFQRINEPPLEKCRFCSAPVRRKIFAPVQLKNAGIYIFDRRFGARDILHDPQFSDRERREIISEIISKAQQPPP